MHQRVLKEILLMELQRLAEEILIDRLPAVGGDVRPTEESLFLHWFAALGSLNA